MIILSFFIGASAGVFVVYLTSEWKGRLLLENIPVYNRLVNKDIVDLLQIFITRDALQIKLPQQ